MELIAAKSIVSKAKSPELWFGAEYNMNIYRGCCHGCIYCDSRSDCYQVDNFDEVKAKENALSIIEKDLKGKRNKGVVATGAMSDPYNPYEAEQRLTRRALELLHKYGFGCCIATKGSLITRDIDILKSIIKHSPVIAKITITSADDKLSKMVEPNAQPSSKRFEAIGGLSRNGIFAGVLLMPILPFIEDNEENLVNIIRLAHESGAKFVYPTLAVSLRDNQKVYFYKALDEKFPGVKEKYIKQYGNSFWCYSSNYKVLMEIIKENCDKYGLLYKMKDIIHAYKSKYQSEQLTLY
ncbi:radical SAM superfamily protein [Oxobacter pfennigii]|uniref:Radical SAM superfamily protein n=1 Tax=Oxobacter pfennigii TaxID=36849 RepID=A0A0P8WM53_9CLOT|nr:radical SAM protein [Oxobacter pfennigii]KPU43582.1 radical SAM superfamily protein [Oxobacter pfennigii]